MKNFYDTRIALKMAQGMIRMIGWDRCYELKITSVSTSSLAFKLILWDSI